MSGHDKTDHDLDAARREVARLIEQLPPVEMSELGLERARRRAHAALATERQRAAQPAIVRVARDAWQRVLLPSAAAAVVVLYLGWAVQAAGALYR